jgi:hypothetical protein
MTPDPLASTQAMLPISLIATPRADLLTCSPLEQVCEVVHRYADYDHIPVTENGLSDSRLLGLLDTHRFRDRISSDKVHDVYVRLCEDHLIGSNASIIEFIWDAAERDCRLLVSGKNISGLVTLSDLQALPVRAALFALVTRLELVMADRIKRDFEGGDGWVSKLSNQRQEKLQKQIDAAKAGDAYVEALLCTQFADKATIIAKSTNFPVSRTKFTRDMAVTQELRDALAHANEYASTRARALRVCATVQAISGWIERLNAPAEG